MPKRGCVETPLERRQSRAWNSREPDAFGSSILKNIKDKEIFCTSFNINFYAHESSELDLLLTTY